MRLESLEPRMMMARDSFVSVGSLTFSFAPDGTQVGSRVSSLQQELGTMASTDQWMAAFARAFQTWSNSAGVNFGLVEDNGAPAGIYGPTRGDPRFGDVRISGFDISLDTYAEAVDGESRAVGSWAGDMVFNTAADWTSLSAIESAAIHEIGHVLGLDHSDDPQSPMYAHGPSGNLVLTPQDIVNLQAIHGPRLRDPNEEGKGNNSIDRASEIKGSDEDQDSADGFDGSQVWVQFGDLHDPSDRDVFEIRTSDEYSGPMAIEVRTKSFSLAKLRFQLTDRDNRLIQSGVVDGILGGIGRIELGSSIKEQEYYLQIFSGSDPFWTRGDYAITIATPQRFQSQGPQIVDWSIDAHRWYYDSDLARDGYSYHLVQGAGLPPVFDDDSDPGDDDHVNAIPLEPALSTSSRQVYRTVGTITDQLDKDQFLIRSPKSFSGPLELTIDVESLQIEGFVPEAVLMRADGTLLPLVQRVRGYGQFQAILSDVAPDTKYIIRLNGGASGAAYRTGGFSLHATFAAPSDAPDALGSGTLNPGQPQWSRELHVARPQLVSFGLQSQATVTSGQIWMSLFDPSMKRLTGLVVPLGQFRSSPGVFLEPGTYFLQIAAATVAGLVPEASFSLSAQRPSQPIGPVIGPDGVQPKFLCPGETDKYCYPTSPTPSNTPVNVSPLPPLQPLPPVSPKAVPAPPDDWFWRNQLLPTNPVLPADVNADQRVSPLDVIAIVNHLNDKGAGLYPPLPVHIGYLDTSNDGSVSPLDALIVVNYLNTKP
jgi:hypothetical protein